MAATTEGTGHGPGDPREDPRAEQTGDESVLGWGEDLRAAGADDPDDDARFLDDVPPHHGS